MELEQSSDFIEKGKTRDIEMLQQFGATSLAYKVRTNGQLCFVKKLRPELRNDKRCRDLFYKEFNTGKNIKSPYIVTYIDITDDADGLCIMMEYVNGKTLKEKIENEPEYFGHKENLNRLLLQLCEAVQTLHKANVVHLDINPSNIIISQVSNTAKLVDLGFCLSDWSNRTAGTTAHFGAPEATMNEIDEIDARSDIYSIGKLLQYIENKTGVKLPGYIKRIKKRCLREQKQQRYNNANEIIHEIKNNRTKKLSVAVAMVIALGAFYPLVLPAYKALENYISWESGHFADKFEEDGIFYRITDHQARTVEVTYKGEHPYDHFLEYNDGEVKIPATVTHHGREFRVTSIDTEAFDNPETTSIIFPEGLETIKDRAFFNCRLTGTVYIPKTVTSIGEWTFNANTCIDSIIVDKANPVYDSRNNCNAIVETATNTLIIACAGTRIPQGITAIGKNAFELFQQPSIDIPESVQHIGQYAFYKSGIKEINIPGSMTAIEENTFELCKMLQRAVLPESIERIGTEAFNDSGLMDITIPDNVTAIGKKAFANCKNLQSVTIGSGVKELGAYAFENCEKLTKVISHIPAKELKATESGCFNGIDKNCILYVPPGAKGAYRNTLGWSQFSRIVEM